MRRGRDAGTSGRRLATERPRVVNGRYESFTVRVWLRGSEVLRGEVVEVGSGERRRFTDLRDIARFIRQQTAPDPAPPGPRVTALAARRRNARPADGA